MPLSRVDDSPMLFTPDEQGWVLPEVETSSAAFLRGQKPLTERLSRTLGLAIFESKV
jgi:hypothetical protein